jgi:hypothetical protein
MPQLRVTAVQVSTCACFKLKIHSRTTHCTLVSFNLKQRPTFVFLSLCGVCDEFKSVV